MPRNASGTYTLPAGNPVVAGTTIDAAWANQTLSDIANELTNSLSRTGAGGMLAPSRVADGSISAPGLSFLNETNSGWYRAGAFNVRLAVNGIDVLQTTPTAVTVPSAVQFTSMNAVIAGLPTPTTPSAAANKQYVDTTITAASTSQTRATYTATGGQTTFSIAYQVGLVDVWLNGSKQVNGDDFTATNGTSVVFTQPLTAGDVVDLVGYGSFVAAAYLPVTGGTMFGPIAFAAGQTLRRNVQVISTNTAAAAGQQYVLTASLTLTLPASPTVGDTVGVSNLSGTTTCVVARNGQPIQGLAEDLTLDTLNAAITLMYADATRGWVFA